MKVHLGSCEYKWTHANTSMEQMWIMRKVGTETYKQVEENNCKWILEHTSSRTLPSDIYCCCNISVEMPDTKEATHFIIKHSEKVT